MLRCEALNLGVSDDSVTCPSCDIDFVSNHQLRKHYFGASNQRGCCWRRINKKVTNLSVKHCRQKSKLQRNKYAKYLPKTSLRWTNTTGAPELGGCCRRLSTVVQQSRVRRRILFYQIAPICRFLSTPRSWRRSIDDYWIDTHRCQNDIVTFWNLITVRFGIDLLA
jgi:hypothetical protein